MAKFEKPLASEFAELKREALEANDSDEDKWRKRIINSVVSILKKTPLQYRSYGPYWWLIKREIINQGFLDFGADLDAEWFEYADYGDSTTNILAAWLYSSNSIDTGKIYSSEHIVTFLQGENEDEIDTRVYTLADEEMELLAIQNNL